MVKIIVHGYHGKMGQVIRELSKMARDFQIVAGIDSMSSTSAMPFPTYRSIEECDMPANVIIDFSTADAVQSVLNYGKEKGLPMVICTTGLSEETERLLEKTSENVAIFKSANMSLGVNLIAALLKKSALLLNDMGFDIEIIEKHHNQKIDSPSGTALLLADAINESLDNTQSYVYNRSQKTEKRSKNEIGIHSLRGGTIVGEHSVIFAGKDEVIELTHIAQSKEVFAVGAIKAAMFIKDKKAGLYTMEDVMNDL